MVCVAILLIFSGLCVGQNVELVPKNAVDTLDFQGETSREWVLSNNIRLTNEYNSEDTGHNSSVAVSKVSMSGENWGTITYTRTVRAYIKVNIQFNIFVNGSTSTSTNNTLVKMNEPDFQVLWGLHGENGDVITDLSKLDTGSKWRQYRVSVETNNATNKYDLRFKIYSGDGVVALDWIKIERTELVGPEYQREEEETITTLLPSIDTTTENTTNHLTNKTNTSSKVTVSPTNNSTVTTIINNNSTEEPKPNSELIGADKDDSSYGYTGEVILICLTVLFAILFLIMVVKYRRLKSHFGDYQLEPAPGQPRPVSRPPEYDNPAYNVQMTYRDAD